MSLRVMFHVQHLLGIGHLRRAACLARAMMRAGLEVDFVSGGEKVAALDLGGARLRQLPPASAADADFSAILDQCGRPIDDAWRMDRCALLLSLFRNIRPDILLIEMFPFGRRQFRFELVPLLEAAGADPRRPLVACSLRDILVEKNRPERVAETLGILRRYFALVLVHGDPGLVRLERTFPRASELAELIAYTGFVVEAPAAPVGPRARDDGEILVSAGGGAVGKTLLKNAIEARPLSRYAGRVWRIITGANLAPEDALGLRAMASGQTGIVIETFRPDFQELLARCAVSVSQAGYNTLLELVAARCPTVVVPFATESESEQALRASLFAAMGALEMVAEADLSPVSLAAAIDRASTPPPLGIDLEGAERSARLLIERRNRVSGP